MFNPAEIGELAALNAARKNGNAAAAISEKLVKWVEYARELEAEVDELKDRLAVKTAHAAGLKAIFDGFKEAHKNSPLMQYSGKYFRDGDAKHIYHDLYERAFDATARELGIDDPAERRAD